MIEASRPGRSIFVWVAATCAAVLVAPLIMRATVLNIANLDATRATMTGGVVSSAQLKRIERQYLFSAEDPRLTANAWSGVGSIRSMTGDRRGALEAYARAAAAGADGEALFDFGRLLLDAGDRSGAIDVLRRVPDSEQFFLRQGANAGQPATALQAYRLAADIRPDSAAVHEALGQAQVYVAHDYAAGIASYRHAAALGLSHPYLAVEIGHAQQMAGDYDGALRTLAGSVAPLAYAIRGDIFLKRSQIDVAVRELERAVALQPNDPWFLTGLGSALCAAGRAADAEAAWKRALAIAPGFAPVGEGRCIPRPVAATPSK